MRFESFIWAVLTLLLAGSAVWDGPADAQDPEPEQQFEALDGPDKIPPP